MKHGLWFSIACLAAAVAPLVPAPTRGGSPQRPFPGWPGSMEGRPLRALPLSDRETGFASAFTGRIARFTDGEREIAVRWVTRATRELHPASMCYRGYGYEVVPQAHVHGADGRQWGSFLATKGSERIRVRERIEDGLGNGWTDVSAWYWAAVLGETDGPWWAITIADDSR